MMDKRWYIVHAYSNFEKKVAESIREQSKQRGLEELFEQVLVPTEKVTEVRRGRKVDAERKFFPGYVLVKMTLTDEAFHLIKNTPKVTGFLGAENKPMPISEAEAMRILHQVQEGVERPKASVSFEIGENVRVADGPFASFSGVVEEIDEARSRVKVAVSIFGRATAGRTGIRSGREGCSRCCRRHSRALTRQSICFVKMFCEDLIDATGRAAGMTRRRRRFRRHAVGRGRMVPAAVEISPSPAEPHHGPVKLPGMVRNSMRSDYRWQRK